MTQTKVDELGQAFKMNTASEKQRLEVWFWHQRLCHASFGYLSKLFPSLSYSFSDSSFKCDVRELVRNHRVSFRSTSTSARWFVSFIDNCTHMTWVCLMKSKSEVCSMFQQFHKVVETQFDAKIKVCHSNNGGESVNYELQKFFTG